jgi:hypothetical protein
MIESLNDAIERWGVKQIKRLIKEYFNQFEAQTLWNKLSQQTEVATQLRARLSARESGFILPHGDEDVYCRWVRSLADPKARAHAMILLQRTQELPKEPWSILKQDACTQFGEKEFQDLLRAHDDSIPKPKAQEAPIFLKTNIILAAIREEEKGSREGWESKIPRTLELLETDATDELTKLLQELKPDSEERKKMSRTTRARINSWTIDELEMQRLMADNTTEGVPVSDDHISKVKAW